ncbi:hypothetical protein, partial [Streptomyces sp. BE303]|uniref:hypothetical protein n=1 Tax=Streptomyces sp. BE303 TaxID=3002528 RepID=UPI002E78C196
APAGRWLAVLPESDTACRVVEALAAVGLDVVPFTVSGPGTGREALAQRVTEALGDGEAPAGELSLMAHEDRPHPEFADLPGAVALTLALVHALGDAGVEAPLWCRVSGTAVLGAGERPGGPVQGAVAGLARLEASVLSAELQVSPAALGEVLPALAGWRAERTATAEADS